MRLPIRRIFEEKRRLVIPVAAGLALNIALYIAVVYPLSARVRGAEVRAQSAAQALNAAQRENAAARGVAAGRDRADAALKALYNEVLPSSFAQATQITFLRLAQLAEQHNLRQSRRSTDPETKRESSLARMRITMSLEGDYEDIRRFIYHLESGTDFIVIDSVMLRQGADGGSELTLELGLSTYYRARTGGA